jgi:DNA (cytosine-5)-methyltransferase 1
MLLILSIFPGIGLLDRPFEELGHCVVRGPDTLWGGNAEAFHAAPSHFDGVIGGPPCQDFSAANRRARPARGRRLLSHFARIVAEAKPAWYLMENVPRCPDVTVPGYSHQRIDVTGHDVGMRQWRLRHFQFGAIDGTHLHVPRIRADVHHAPPACMASAASHTSTRWGTFCARQGVDRPLSLPPFTRAARYAAVGNGVPLPMGRLLARAITSRAESHGPLCACGCGRSIEGKQRSATPGCRKRLERRQTTQ